MAILDRPSLLVGDEPTSALDVIPQAEILALFAELNRKLGMSIFYISHDLPSVASLCHRIAILHEGEIVECGSPEQIFLAPRHPFIRKLVAALAAVPAGLKGARGAAARETRLSVWASGGGKRSP